MVELCIKVRASALQISEENAIAKLRLNSRLMVANAVLIAALGTLHLISVPAVLAGEGEGEKKDLLFTYGINYVGWMLIYLASILFTASCCVVVTTRRYFEHLKAEASRVKTINIVFTSAYLSRALVFFTFYIGYPKKIGGYAYILAYVIGYNFWDTIPLCLIMTYHYSNFLTERATSENDSSEEATTENEEESTYQRTESVSYGSESGTDEEEPIDRHSEVPPINDDQFKLENATTNERTKSAESPNCQKLLPH